MADIMDLLGLGAPDGNVFNITTGNGAPVSSDQAPVSQPVAQQAPAYHKPHGIGDFLGRLGDALLVAHGREPIYQKRIDQEQQRQALSGFLTDPDTAIQNLMQIDPKQGIELYSQVHPKSEVPEGLREFLYYQNMPADRRPQYEKFLQLTHPGMMAPVTLGAGDTVQMPGSSGPPQAAIDHLKAHPELAPQFDDKYGKGASVKVLGGATASTPSPTFP